MLLKPQIEMYLKANDLKPYELADKIGIARSILYDFLAEKRDIRLSIAEKIRKFIENGA